MRYYNCGTFPPTMDTGDGDFAMGKGLTCPYISRTLWWSHFGDVVRILWMLWLGTAWGRQFRSWYEIIGSGRGVIYNPIGKSSCVVKKGTTTRNHIIVPFWEFEETDLGGEGSGLGWIRCRFGGGICLLLHLGLTWCWYKSTKFMHFSLRLLLLHIVIKGIQRLECKNERHACNTLGRISPNCILFFTYYFTF